MAAKKIQAQLTPEEKLQQALVPEAEQPYKVPANWCWTRLKFISTIISKGTTPKGGKSVYKNVGVNFLRVENIGDDGVISHDNMMCISEELHNSFLKRSILKEKDVLVSIAGTLGKTAIVKKFDLPMNTNQAISFIRLFHRFINEVYIKYVIGDPVINGLLLKKTKVTSIPNLTLEIIGDCPIPLPPLAEQQRIVERIESLFVKLDEAKENLQNVLDGFETRKAAILHKAFTGELTVNWRKQHGVSMDSWEEKSLKDCSILITKGSSPRWQGFEYINDITQTLFITSENVREGFLDLTKRKYLDNKINEIQKRSILKKGDVLVNIVGASIGRSAIFEFDCLANTNQAVCIVRTNKLLYNRFLCFFLNSPRALVYYDSNKVETARANISLTDIANIQISIPSISEQTEIVRIIDDLLAKEQQVKEIAEDALAKIDLIKKSILASAFRGELGTNNPADEAAVELLKRVL